MTDPQMVDHRAFLRQLPVQTRQRLLLRSNRQGLRHLAIHWGLIAFVGTLIVMAVPYWQVLLPVEGVLLIFNFTLLHECTHQTPFRTKWLNEVVGRISGVVVGLPFLWFRYFHMAHHKYTNDPVKDPELVGHEKPWNWRTYLWHLSGVQIWVGQANTLVRIAFGLQKFDFVPKSKRIPIQVESVLIVIFYILIAVYSLTISTMLIKLWVLPVILGQPFLRLYLMAEHGRCPSVANMFENSRTTYTIFALRFLAWNMPFHAEHHSLPNVPFHHLPEFNQLAARHLLSTEDGYARFHKKYILEKTVTH